MVGEWYETTVECAFEVNPPRPLKRGVITPFISMDLLPVNARSAERIDSREYTGSGMRFRNGDTLIARITPCLENGKTAFVSALADDEIAHGSTEYIVLAGKKDKTDSLFGYYLARTPDFRSYAINHMEGTSGRQRVPASAIEAYKLLLPPIEEQRAIAHILGTLDDKIELNRKQNETLEAMARALFKAWFVDFEPVRAKLDGRWQRGQSLPGLPAHLYDLFPDRLVESELGEIPEGWEKVPASTLIDFNPKEPLRKGTEAPYLDMASLPTVGSWPELPVLRAFGSGMRFRNGDTLLARITPCLQNGKTAFIQCLPDGVLGWGSTEYIVMRPKPPVPAEFGYLLARDVAFREQAIRSMTGTSGRQRAQADSVMAFKIAAPSSDAVWDAFSHVTALQFKSIKANAGAIETLAQLRDTLLPKLISGELRVPDADKRIKGAIA